MYTRSMKTISLGIVFLGKVKHFFGTILNHFEFLFKNNITQHKHAQTCTNMYRHTHTRLTTFSERVNPVCGNLITDIRPIHNTLSHTPAVNTIVWLFGLSHGGGVCELPLPPPIPTALTCFIRIFFVICCLSIAEQFYL